jgi:hypothetical protein
LITGADAVPPTTTFEPADTDKTPLFDTVTLPVDPETPIPEPATRPVTPALLRPRVLDPGTDTKDKPPAFDRAFAKTKRFGKGSVTETPAPVEVLILTDESDVESEANCACVANK